MCERSVDETKIMLACEDGTIVSFPSHSLSLSLSLSLSSLFLGIINYWQVLHDVIGGKTTSTQSFIVSPITCGKM